MIPGPEYDTIVAYFAAVLGLVEVGGGVEGCIRWTPSGGPEPAKLVAPTARGEIAKTRGR